MSTSQKEFDKMVKKASPPSAVLKNCVIAFAVGGFICALGQVLSMLYFKCGMNIEDAKTVSTISLIFLSALFTACRIYDDIAKHAGAGTLVPITGFANSIVSPAIEFKTEGFVLGMGAKMFIIAGPVLVFGITASVVYGIIYWLVTAVF